MTAPIRKLETDEAIELLAEYSRSGNYTELDLMRIERKIKGLLSKGSVNPSHCHMIFGIIWFLMGDRRKCESAWRNSFLLGPGDPIVMMNGMVALTCIGNLSEAIVAINAAVERFPDNKRVLACATMQALQALQFSLGMNLMLEYDKLAINDHTDQIAAPRKQLMLIKESAETYGMTEAQMLERLETAVESVRRSGFEVRRTSTMGLHDGTFIYNLYLSADSPTCAETNFHIAESLIEKFDDTGIDLFSIVCRPLSDFAATGTIQGTV